MSNEIKITIDAPKLTPEKFQKAVNEFLSIVKGVTKNATGNYSPEDWVVEVSAGSAVIGARNPDGLKSEVTTAIDRGFRSLMSGIPAIPQFFTKEEVESAKALVSLIDDDAKYIKSIIIQNGASPIELNSEVVKTAEIILAGEKQIAFGSLEGRIEALFRKEGQPMTSALKDPIHGRNINCTFTKIEIEDEALRAFKNNCRVLLSGLIHYTKEGSPKTIDVNFVRIFPPENELPTLEDIHAFFR